MGMDIRRPIIKPRINREAFVYSGDKNEFKFKEKARYVRMIQVNGNDLGSGYYWEHDEIRNTVKCEYDYEINDVIGIEYVV